ncbi:hypothetical protein ACFV1L_34310 [Kitasatospora sp. NPDC059646]|uniref:hypothetical protein n=1 Tax=Kitasatospora sp. NPDC059646 TaxID=3346893 RepID=UPI0036C429FC
MPFDATFTVVWQPAFRRRANLAEQVRSDLRVAAGKVTADLMPDDLLGAEDTLNAVFGAPEGRVGPHYLLCSAKFDLRLSPMAAQALAVRRADTERIRRLEFLKASLYDRPDLVVLDYLERRSVLPDDTEVADLERIARAIRSHDSWWQPLLELWESVGAGFRDPGIQHEAMKVLLQLSVDALKGVAGPSAPGTPDRWPG